MPIRFFTEITQKISPKLMIPMASLLKIFPSKQENGNQSPTTYPKMNFSTFGYRENAKKRRPLALPPLSRDPPASSAIVHPNGG
jgi:hypothetical protein